MRTLGIDYGTKRIGIALSDEGGGFALPHSVIANRMMLATNPSSLDELAAEIIAVARENAAEDIVMGESRDYHGEANKVMPAILELKKALESAGLTVHLEPEFMTSVQA